MVALLVLMFYSYICTRKRGGNKMINYNEQEKQEVLNLVKKYLQSEGEEMVTISLINYQEQEDDETDEVHYEVYESNIDIESESTLSEVQEQIVYSEKLVKTYKTKKGLLNAFLKAKDVAGSKYKVYTRL